MFDAETVMKAAVIVLAFLLVIAHPAAATTILGAELGVCGALGWLAWRALRRHPYPYRRTS